MIENFLNKTLNSSKYKFWVIFIVMALFVISLILIPLKTVQVKMLPNKDTNTFTIYIDTDTNSNIDYTKQISQCVIDNIKNDKNILNLELFLSEGAPLDYAGLAKGSMFKRSQNEAELVVNLIKNKDISSFNLIHQLRRVVQKNCKGANIKFVEQPAGPPVLASIVLEVYSDDIDGNRVVSEKIAKIVGKTPKIVDVDILQDDIYDTYQIVPNISKILRSGLDISQVNNILYVAFKGMKVSIKNDKDFSEQIPIFVILDKSKNLSGNSPEALENKLSSLKLMNRMGVMIPLSEMVQIKKIQSSPMVMMKDLNYINVIIAETDLESQVYPLLDIRKQIIKEFENNNFKVDKVGLLNLKLTDKLTSSSYELKFDGEMKVSLDTFRDLGLAFIAALILIFFLIVAYYGSYMISAIVLFGSFLSIFGIIFGHILVDFLMPDTFYLTATSLIGFIALMGINARNSLLLIDFVNLLLKDGCLVHHALAKSCQTRAKPIFLTVITVVLASIPLVFDPVFGGLGVAMIFGSMTSMVISLLFVPILLSKTKYFKEEK